MSRGADSQEGLIVSPCYMGLQTFEDRNAFANE